MTQDSNSSQNSNQYNFLIYLFVAVFSIVIGVEVWGFFKYDNTKKDEIENSSNEIIQVDVLNGCGVSGVGQKMTDRLRDGGFDVVASGNYKNFLIEETFIIDRVGLDESAKNIASVLNLGNEKIIREINPGYFVSFSIVVGKDYKKQILKKE
ncbi:MAG: LytR C-terminal domain-containing protein [Bacteroidota bacterium]